MRRGQRSPWTPRCQECPKKPPFAPPPALSGTEHTAPGARDGARLSAGPSPYRPPGPREGLGKCGARVMPLTEAPLWGKDAEISVELMTLYYRNV